MGFDKASARDSIYISEMLMREMAGWGSISKSGPLCIISLLKEQFIMSKGDSRVISGTNRIPLSLTAQKGGT